jgi:phenylacetate-CoA ligase
MISKLIECAERTALHLPPERGKQFLGLIPDSLLKQMQAARFRRTVRLVAASSPFYREEFRRRGIDARRVRRPEDLGDFYTTGEDLRRNGPEAFTVRRADTAFETTGTTSPVPKRVFFSNRELEEVGRVCALALRFLGLTRDDKILSAFDCSFWVSPAVLRSALQYIRCFHVEAGKIEPLDFYERALDYRPNVVMGEPSWLVRLSEIAEARGVWPVKFLIAGGENIAETARAAVERVWSAPLYLNYGQTEAFGALGVECTERDGYHRNDLNFLFEVADADMEGYGELVYTTLNREAMPLVRYRSTDITRTVEEPCPCGLFARRIAKVRARADEMVVCGMGNVGPWVFAEILAGVPAAGADWQAVVKNDGRRDVIELHVETDDAARQLEIEGQVRARLRERFADFWKNHEMRLYELQVIACPRGSLRLGRKLRRVVDERHLLMRQVI